METAQLKPTMTLNLPFYKTEKSFRRFIDIFNKAVAIYPDAFVHKPSNSIETFCRDFRYARSSAIEYGYCTLLADPIRYRAIYQQIKLATRGENCVIGGEEGIKKYTDQESKLKEHKLQEHASVVPEDFITFTGTEKEIAILCQFIRKRQFAPMPIFHITIDPITKERLEQVVDNLFDQVNNEPNTYRII